MQYLLFTGSNGYTSIYGFETPEQLTELLTSFNVAAGEYATVPNIDALPTGWQNYQKAVTFTPNPTPSYNFDFALAQLDAKGQVTLQYEVLANNSLSLVPTLVFSAQMALPEVDRMPVVQEVTTNLNLLAADLQATYDLIDTATTIDDLNAIVNADPVSISGTILIDRDGFTLDTAVFSSLSGVSAEATELFFPGTSTTLTYDTLAAGFTSNGIDVFAAGDFNCVLRYSGGTIATFAVTSEAQTSFPFSYTPPA